MASSTKPQVDCETINPGLPVRDIMAAVDFYVQKLGFSVGFIWGDPPTIAGVRLGQVAVHLWKGEPQAGGASVYFAVGDADELFEYQRSNGAEVVEPPGDRPYAMRDYRVRDLDGHVLGFGHYLPETQPALEIERVAVALRLEKRLAGLLTELADFKGMNLAACLEETLLHSLEPEGVHSPHTQRQLRYIQELKQKHGIDYDAHASYRFVEK